MIQRGVIRLSITLDCWKNSCQGATVVPTIAMISSTEVEDAPPWIPGTKKSWAIGPMWGCAMKNSGTARKLVNTKMNITRSQRRKLPLAVMATSRTAAIGTETYSEMPK